MEGFWFATERRRGVYFSDYGRERARRSDVSGPSRPERHAPDAGRTPRASERPPLDAVRPTPPKRLGLVDGDVDLDTSLDVDVEDLAEHLGRGVEVDETPETGRRKNELAKDIRQRVGA